MSSEPLHVRANTTGRVISVIPHMLGYQPAEGDLVIIGVADQPDGRQKIGVAMRYDMIEPGCAPGVADHAQAILHREGMRQAIAIGYGPGQRVTPNMDIVRQHLTQAGIGVGEAARVNEGRWWSYLCTEPSCHPADGVVLEADRLDAQILHRIGEARASREELAATIAPLTGEQADAQREIDGRVAGSRRLTAIHAGHNADRELYRLGVETVDRAITAAREGAEVSDADHARLAQAMTDTRVRDAAWARMDPAYAEQHQQLWTGTVRRAQPGTAAAPATLLAFTAAQRGNGALANVALDRAREDAPGYSMAWLLQQALDAGVKPADLAPPMTPEEVDAAYGYPGPDADSEAVTGSVDPVPAASSQAPSLAAADRDAEAGA